MTGRVTSPPKCVLQIESCLVATTFNDVGQAETVLESQHHASFTMVSAHSYDYIEGVGEEGLISKSMQFTVHLSA